MAPNILYFSYICLFHLNIGTMSSFIIYTYQFAPRIDTIDRYSNLFPESVVSPESVMKDKQQAFQSLFADDSSFTFTVGDETYNHQILLNSGGIIILRIANNKRIRHEENFVVRDIEDQPSCIVLIDNRHDCQSIAIQEKRTAFFSTDQVARIMKKAFNSVLCRKFLVVDILRRLEEKSFWNLVKRYPDGIKAVRFGLSYPNLPRVSDNVRDMFTELAKEFGANSKYEINAIEGQHLNLNDNSEYLQGLVSASCESGQGIKILPAGSKERWVAVGKDSNVAVEIPEALFATAEGRLFDDRFERIAKIMNKLK